MADLYISKGRYAEAIDIYNKLFENIPFNTSVLQRAKEMEGLLTIIGKGKQGRKWIEKFLNIANQDKVSFTDVFPILPAGDRRAYKRIAFVKALRFYVTVLLDAEILEKVYYTGASIDISKEGISMITDCLLFKGDVVFFEPEIRGHDIREKSAIVRWVKEIEKKKYRFGLMFI
jgi:tetratricopeptide (TPR) repeat protein